MGDWQDNSGGYISSSEICARRSRKRHAHDLALNGERYLAEGTQISREWAGIGVGWCEMRECNWAPPEFVDATTASCPPKELCHGSLAVPELSLESSGRY